MNYYFNEWYKEQDALFLSTVRDGAEAAWFAQQEKIDELQKEIEMLENKLYECLEKEDQL